MALERFRRFIALWIVTVLVLAIGHPAGAQSGAFAPVAEAEKRLRALNLLQGSPGEIDLETNMTRAELIAIMMRAFGEDAEAVKSQGTSPFPDVGSDHWAAGFIAKAKELIEQNGQQLGYPNGTFAPDQDLSALEAVVFLMKFMGIAADETLPWPDNYLVPAVEAGFISPADAQLLRQGESSSMQAGQAFVLLDHGFMNYTSPDTGQSVYESIASELTIALDAYPATTQASEVTLRGTVSAQPTAVYANNVPATVTGEAFVVTVPLSVGVNSITVTAHDDAGLAGMTTIKIERVEPPSLPPPVQARPHVTNVECENVAGHIHCDVSTNRATQVKAWLDIKDHVCEDDPSLCPSFVFDRGGGLFEVVFVTDPAGPPHTTVYIVAVNGKGRESPIVSVPAPPPPKPD